MQRISHSTYINLLYNILYKEYVMLIESVVGIYEKNELNGTELVSIINMIILYYFFWFVFSEFLWSKEKVRNTKKSSKKYVTQAEESPSGVTKSTNQLN